MTLIATSEPLVIVVAESMEYAPVNITKPFPSDILVSVFAVAPDELPTQAVHGTFDVVKSILSDIMIQYNYEYQRLRHCLFCEGCPYK